MGITVTMMMIINDEEQTADLNNSGKHVCCIYDTRQELLETILSFCCTNDYKDEKEIFVMDNRFAGIGDNIKQKLQGKGMERNCISLFFINTDEVYQTKDSFDPFLTISVLIQQVREARLQGFKAVRYILDMNWSDYENWALLDYERRINQYLIPQYPCTALCLYNLKRLNPYLLKNIITQHPQIMNKGNIIENRYYNPPNPILGLRSGEQKIQALLKRISLEQYPTANTYSIRIGQITNCYRALLAIVNYLGSICSRKEYLTDIYQDLSEVAYYIMDDNKYCLLKGIEQLTISINDLENEFKLEDKEKDATFRLTLNEIRTHIQYLRIQFNQGPSDPLISKKPDSSSL